MSDAASPLGPAALDLLLTILEQPTPALSGAVAEDHFPDEFAALREAGVLHTDGHEMDSAAPSDFDDVPTALTWLPDRGGFGYFSGAAGWIEVPEARLLRHAVRPPDVLALAMVALRRSQPSAVVVIVPDLVWDLGQVRLAGRDHAVSVWYGRRLFDEVVWRSLREAALAKPPAHQRIVLTSTPYPQLTDRVLTSHAVIGLWDVTSTGGLAIDPALLAARLGGMPVPSLGDGLELLADGHEVRLRGVTFRFPRGQKQRQVIKYLHTEFLRGNTKVASAEIVVALGWDARTRLRDVFQRQPAWGRLLAERDGMCGFCLEPPDPS